MPWHIENDNPGCNGYAVVKDEDGEVEGCHRTQAQAQRQVDALYASENDMTDRAVLPPIVVTDIDGTILDDNGDPINGTLQQINSKNEDVYVLTGRSSGRRAETETQLENIGLDFEQLLMVGSQGAKTEAMKNLLLSFDVTDAYENDPEVIAAYRSLNVNVHQPSQRHTLQATYSRREEVEKILADLRAAR